MKTDFAGLTLLRIASPIISFFDIKQFGIFIMTISPITSNAEKILSSSDWVKLLVRTSFSIWGITIRKIFLCNNNLQKFFATYLIDYLPYLFWFYPYSHLF